MGGLIMLTKCKKCGKEYELPKEHKTSDYQCDCGGTLRKVPPKPDYFINKKEGGKNLGKLINCPICKHELSSNAVTCQNCGNFTGKKIEDQTWVLIALLLPAIGMLAGLCFGIKEREGWRGIIAFSVVGIIFHLVLWYILFGALLSVNF